MINEDLHYKPGTTESKKEFNLSRIIAASVLTLILSIVSYGQGDSFIKGSVSDEKGGKIAVAEVRLRSRIGSQLTTVTDKNGTFTFANLPSSQYLLEIKAKDFATLVSDEISVERGKELQL